MKHVTSSSIFRLGSIVAIIYFLLVGVACAAAPATAAAPKAPSTAEPYFLPDWDCNLQTTKVVAASDVSVLITYITVDGKIGVIITNEMYRNPKKLVGAKYPR